jgi:hypothetical protein
MARRGDDDAGKATASRWYLADKNKAHSAVAVTCDYIRSQQSDQRREMRHHMELYSAGNVAGLGSTGETAADRLFRYMYTGRAASRFNMSAAVCDTALSMIAQAPAVPQYLTVSGDFGLQRKAEKRSQVLQCQMNDLATDILTEAFLDACKVGSGFITGYLDEEGLPVLERVHPLEILVEHADGINGAPRSIHRVRLRSREVLKAEYPAQAWEIEKAPAPSSDCVSAFFLERVASGSDMIEVYESHHLRSSKRAKDGRHTICLQTATLLDESFDVDELPYPQVRYRKRDFGFFGAGLVEATREPQNRVNELIERVARGQDLASTLIIANPNGEGAVKTEQLSNEIGLIVNYDPEVGPPQLMKWDGTLSDLQEQIDLEFERVLKVEGLSQEQVNGEGAGDGLTSGVAVRAADDVQSRRLVAPTKRYQSFCIDVAKLLERLNDEAVRESDGEFTVTGKATEGRRTFLESSKWAELAIPDGQVNIVMAPMSALPTTPQGKWAAVQEWIGSGFISQQYAMSLLQFPDIDAYADLELAHLDMVQWQITQLLDGKPVLPTPRQNLQIAMDLGTKSELKAMMMHAPDNIIDLMENFLVACGNMLKAAQPPAPPMPVPMQGPAPGGPPGARPPGPLPQGPVAPMGPPVMQPRPQQPVMRPGVAA